MDRQRRRRPISDRFEDLSAAVTRWTGSTSAFACALAVVVGWAGRKEEQSFSAAFAAFAFQGCVSYSDVLLGGIVISRTHF